MKLPGGAVIQTAPKFIGKIKKNDNRDCQNDQCPYMGYLNLNPKTFNRRLRNRLRKDPLEQVDSGDRVVKVFCKVFERSEGSDRADFELALAA